MPPASPIPAPRPADGARRVPDVTLRGAWQAVQIAAGIGVAWGFFYLAACKLASLPRFFHEGMIWKQTLLGAPDE